MRGHVAPAREGGRQCFLHILDAADQRGAVPQKGVASGRTGIERVAWDGQHLTPLVGGGPRRDEATRPFGRLDHNDPEG